MAVTDRLGLQEQTSGMKLYKPFISEFEIYSDAAFSVVSFTLVVGVLYWAVRLGCAEVFRTILAR